MAEEDRETPHSHHVSCRMNQNEIVRYTSLSKRQATSLRLTVVPSGTEQAQRERASYLRMAVRARATPLGRRVETLPVSPHLGVPLVVAE